VPFGLLLMGLMGERGWFVWAALLFFIGTGTQPVSEEVRLPPRRAAGAAAALLFVSASSGSVSMGR
jgi:hypothetical protein